MANKNFTVQYLIRMREKFASDANKVSKSSNKMSKSIDGTSKKLRKLESQSRRTAKGLKQMGSGFKSSVANFAAGFLTFQGVSKFITEGAKFQDSMADVAAITGAAGKDLKFFSDESLRLAKSANTAQSEVATAFKTIASAKSELLKDPKGLSLVTEQVLLLKNATGLELAGAAQITTEAMNQFGLGAEEAGRVVNVLAAGSKVGASEVAETGVAIVKAGVAAKLAGLSFEQTNSAIQVLAKNGLKAEVAGTGLQGVLLKLEAQTNKKFKPSIVGFSKALENLEAANLSTTQQTKMFGLEGIKVGNILLSNSNLVRKWTGEITGTNQATVQAEARLATFNSKMKKIGIVINDALIKSFIRLEPMLSTMATQFADFVGSIDDSNIKAFADTVMVLVNALKMIGFFIKEALGLLKGFGEVIGQTLGALATFDFGQFDLGDAFRIGSPEISGGGAKELATGKVDKSEVALSVALDEGLKPGKKRKSRSNAGRTDVGAAMAGA